MDNSEDEFLSSIYLYNNSSPEYENIRKHLFEILEIYKKKISQSNPDELIENIYKFINYHNIIYDYIKLNEMSINKKNNTINDFEYDMSI